MDDKKVKVVFGLEAQGHIPTIERIIKKWNDSYVDQFPNDKPIDMKFTKHVWEEIGREIGWEPFTASLYYFRYLSK